MDVPTQDEIRRLIAYRESQEGRREAPSAMPQSSHDERDSSHVDQDEIRRVIAYREKQAAKNKTWGDTAVEFAKDLPLNVGKLGRSVAAGVAGVADLPLLPVHLGRMAAGKEPYFVSDLVKQGIDTLTHNKLQPTSTLGKAVAGGVEAIAGMKPTGSMLKGAAHLMKDALPRTSKFAGNMAKGMELTAPNVAAAGLGGGTMGALNADPTMTAYESVPLSMLAGMAGHKGASMIQRGGIKAAFAGSPSAALRHSPIGQHYEKGLGKDLHEFMDVNPEAVGKDISESIARYHKHHKNRFAREAAHIAREVKKWHLQHGDGTSSHLTVDLKKPLDWSLKLVSRAQTPLDAQIWANSELGKQTMRVLQIKPALRRLAKTDPERFREVMEVQHQRLRNGELHAAKIPYSSALRFRQSLDDVLSVKEFRQIGNISEGEIKNFRKLTNKQLEDALHKADPALAKRQKKYAQEYGRYAETKIPLMNELRMERPFPGNVYEKSKKDLGAHGYMPEFTMEAMDQATPKYSAKHKEWQKIKGNKEEYAKALIKDMGRKGSQIDIGELHDALYALNEKPRRMILNGLSPEKRAQVEQQLERYARYRENLGEISMADAAYRTHGIGLWTTLAKNARQHLLRKYWKSEKGRKSLDAYLDAMNTPEGAKKNSLYDSSFKHMYRYQTLPRSMEAMRHKREERKGKRKG